jgi:hypothetical protein
MIGGFIGEKFRHPTAPQAKLGPAIVKAERFTVTGGSAGLQPVTVKLVEKPGTKMLNEGMGVAVAMWIEPTPVVVKVLGI